MIFYNSCGCIKDFLHILFFEKEGNLTRDVLLYVHSPLDVFLWGWRFLCGFCFRTLGGIAGTLRRGRWWRTGAFGRGILVWQVSQITTAPKKTLRFAAGSRCFFFRDTVSKHQEVTKLRPPEKVWNFRCSPCWVLENLNLHFRSEFWRGWRHLIICYLEFYQSIAPVAQGGLWSTKGAITAGFNWLPGRCWARKWSIHIRDLDRSDLIKTFHLSWSWKTAKVLALAMAQCANALPSHSLLAFSAFFALPEVGCRVVLLMTEIRRFPTWDVWNLVNNGIDSDRLPTSTGDRRISATCRPGGPARTMSSAVLGSYGWVSKSLLGAM